MNLMTFVNGLHPWYRVTAISVIIETPKPIQMNGVKYRQQEPNSLTILTQNNIQSK